MAKMAENGQWYPTLVTSIIVLVLSLWSLYGLSGAKIIFRLPLLKLGLIVISLVYLVRGVAFFAIVPMFPENSFTFWLVSSGICLTMGILYSVGIFQSLKKLSIKNA
jgi:hypothetical protein